MNKKKTKDELPIFPEGLPVIKDTGDLPILKLSPDKIIISAEHVFMAREVRSVSNIEQICRWIFNYPERKFYLFLVEGNKENREIIYNIEKNGILASTTERHFYQHPSDGPKDFIRIFPNNIEFDWEKEVLEKGPKYVRLELTLSERKKRELEIKEKIDKERESDLNPIEIKPSFFGISFDVYKALRWLKKIFSKNKL
jgi:hypothetical protein